ncbi:hypothetical protein S40285_04972 [Stachybotrys chlorohalonatus IBT 40285]|uniref:Small-subunit processome Utp12 domain-containing protein n=1 Tax=Stachybotrys chlorohalonatus (strain IBT 40285) TaxID=1283841 RepID=A0A084QRU6_STAC4|nr:hypothetical protein S40285_04972 [Stachybotrys chlorohalonata IBT 40285]
MPVSTERKAPGKLAAPVVKSAAKPVTKSTIDESRTSVAGTDAIPRQPAIETIEISSGTDSDEDLSDYEAAVSAPSAAAAEVNAAAQTNGQVSAKPTLSEDVEIADSEDEPTSPSFGELLRGSEAIDVPALLQQSATASNSLHRPSNLGIAPPSGQTLITVLTQALKTDDTDLLESCLHTKDLNVIRQTIERIDSLLAGTLLNRLASRLYRRPGRAGVLMTWIQWTLVAHGGAIASQPKVLHGLSGLQKVLAERSKGLSSLLALKGKLDMLESQMDLRKRMQQSTRKAQGEVDEDEEEEDVIWVEGETNDNGTHSKRRALEDDEDDMAPTANGFLGESDDDDESDAEEEDDDDEEAVELLDEDEVDHEDVDDSMAEDDESDAEPAPPAKVQKVSRAFSKRV